MSAPVAVVVALHGYDSDAAHADELARELDPSHRCHHVSPEGPVVLADGARAWFEVEQDGSVEAAVSTVRSVLASLSSDAGIDLSRVAVVGYSQGAAAALAALATTGAPSVGALVCINGFVVDAVGLTYDWTCLRHTRVLLQHGEEDDVVPSFFSADLAAILTDARIEVELQSFAMGHERSPASITAGRAWLEGT